MIDRRPRLLGACAIALVVAAAGALATACSSSSPPSNPGVLDGGSDAAPAFTRCSFLDAGSLIAARAADGPPPGFQGGAIASGTYVSSAITFYDSTLVADAGPAACLGFDAGSYAWAFAPNSTGTSGSVAELLARPDHQGFVFPQSSGRYSTTGSTLSYTSNCSACCQGPTLDVTRACAAQYCAASALDGGPAELAYTAQDAQLLLGVTSLPAGCGTLVITLERQ